MLVPKDILGFEGLYEIHPNGQIRQTQKDYFVKVGICPQGYPFVKLYEGSRIWSTRRVHRLLATTFIPNIDKKPYVNHKDGNKQNNSLDNLEWCTAQENSRHAWDNQLCTKPPKLDQETRLKALQEYFTGASRNTLMSKYSCGRRLMDWLEETAQEAGVLSEFLSVRKANKSETCKESGKTISKEVRQLSLDGMTIQTFSSVISAAKALGIRQGNISNVLAGRCQTSGGFKWEWA